MIEPTPHPQSPPPQKRRVATRLLLGVSLLILCVAIGWILSINNIISSLWASIFSAVVAVLGVLLPFVQGHVQSPSEPLLSVTQSLDSKQIQSNRQIHIRDVRLGVNRQKGAIVIYTGKRLRGSTISLCKGFQTNLMDATEATNVAERTIDGVAVFVGIFPALEPGNYTVFDKQQKFVSEITVYAKYVTPVDWR